MVSLRKRTSKYIKYDSENEDDPPEPFQSSGDEWTEDFEPKKKGRRSSGRAKRRSRRNTSDSSEEISEEESPKRRNRNGVFKKFKANESPPAPQTQTQTPQTTAASSPAATTAAAPAPVSTTQTPRKVVDLREYATGSFLIVKKDAQVGDPNKHPCIWRVDGKALLQKYEPFEDGGKIRHKTTSVYTGWSALDRDLYAPINVQVTNHNNQTMIVDFNWDQLKEINNDSD